MREIPDGLSESLLSGAATLCRCWRLERRDGRLYGFTDHDEDVVLDGLVCRASSALSASDVQAGLGLSAAGLEVAGALSDDDLVADELDAGLFDGAKVEMWLVDWRDPSQRMRLFAGRLGRVRRGEVHFEAELRSLASALGETRGRLYGHLCDAELGDARCGVNLDDPRWRGTGTVISASGTQVRLAGLSGYAEGLFVHGRLEVTSGPARGFAAAVRAHDLRGPETVLGLDRELPATLAAGDEVSVIAGCDKSLATCRDRFGNVSNFRGFPHMPGNDFLMAYPRQGDPDNDGGSLNA